MLFFIQQHSNINIVLIQYNKENIMDKGEDPPKDIKLTQYSSIFAQNYSTLSSDDSLYVIIGHQKSGKSVFIDLLAGKQLTIYQDPQFQIQMVVQKNNYEREYHPLYIKKLNSQIAIQSFTLLDEELKTSSLQTIKLIFLQHFAKICKKVAFIVLVEQGSKESIPIYFESLLQNFGITPNNKNANVDTLKKCIYLLFTKTEQGQLEDAKQVLKDLSQNCQNKNVKEIIDYLVEKDSIDQFRTMTPEEGYVDRIKNKFETKTLDKNLLELLNKSTRRVDRPFIEADQDQAIVLLSQISKLITSLVLFAITEDKIYQRQYEDLAKRLYPDNIRINKINLMVGKWNKSALEEIKKIKNLSTIKDTSELFQAYSQCLIQLLKTLQSANDDKIIFKQIQAKIIFFTALSWWWFSSNTFDNKIKQIITHFINSINKAQQSQKPKNEVKAKPARPPAKKNNAFDNFRQDFQQCKNNRQAIQICLKKIKTKEADEKYDYFEVIFYIKLLRDLLQEFVSPNSSENHIFILELLQLSFYTENYYDFQNYLKSALRNKVLHVKPAKFYLKALYDASKFEYCQRIIDYLIAQSRDEEQFQKFAQFKVNLKIKINQYYKNRQEIDNKGKGETKKKKITFQYNDLIRRGEKVTSLRSYLEGKDFEKHILSKQ